MFSRIFGGCRKTNEAWDPQIPSIRWLDWLWSATFQKEPFSKITSSWFHVNSCWEPLPPRTILLNYPKIFKNMNDESLLFWKLLKDSIRKYKTAEHRRHRFLCIIQMKNLQFEPCHLSAFCLVAGTFDCIVSMAIEWSYLDCGQCSPG
jgi:hypothetical protein